MGSFPIITPLANEPSFWNTVKKKEMKIMDNVQNSSHCNKISGQTLFDSLYPNAQNIKPCYFRDSLYKAGREM